MNHQKAVEVDEIDDDDDPPHDHGPPGQTRVGRRRPVEVLGFSCKQIEEQRGVHGQHQNGCQSVDLPNCFVTLFERFSTRVGFIVSIFPQPPMVDGVEPFEEWDEFEEITNWAVSKRFSRFFAPAHSSTTTPPRYQITVFVEAC